MWETIEDSSPTVYRHKLTGEQVSSRPKAEERVWAGTGSSRRWISHIDEIVNVYKLDPPSYSTIGKWREAVVRRAWEIENKKWKIEKRNKIHLQCQHLSHTLKHEIHLALVCLGIYMEERRGNEQLGEY